MLPQDTARLRFRDMTPEDLDLMAGLLGDPEVMTYYPAPKTRDESAKWIAWNEANYARHGYGLWIVETHDGEFLGDCGLTWQKINGENIELEVGYHVRADRQGRGYATEAAAACRDFARETLQAPRLVALIHPENTASKRVAEKLGMAPVDEDFGGPIPVRTVMGMNLR
ncbi:GNAT family N-acetyltransferase [Arthrobacter koreensis]|uniref:GNAT family N-acetyltransferase n=1 Tax=Arthrobacter koreensis TaxID=199136 RepID=UPI000B00D80D|nr:GNAT family N-acetyltransferase [Arthrobacter koreensis]